MTKNSEAIKFPIKSTPHFNSLVEGPDPLVDPIGAQIFPDTEKEARILAYEDPDPLGDQVHSTTSRIVHHYPDRVLFLVNHTCALYCRFCFRRHFTGHGAGITEKEVQEAVVYVSERPQIKEVILSGGDPLLLNSQTLRGILESFYKKREDLYFRIGTRLPVVAPNSINQAKLDLFADFAPLWMTLHINHPKEISPEFIGCAKKLSAAGVTLLSQTVLLKGVNDDLNTLISLFRGLVKVGIKPYYLFQGDLAAGTSHFRVNLVRAIDLMEELERLVSGMAVPKLAVDLPNGKGKIHLTRDKILHEDEEWYYLKSRRGELIPYPKEDLNELNQ